MIKINDLNFVERVALEVLWGLTWVFSILPHWVKFHLIEPVLYFLFCHVLRYRHRVVDANLKNSFPEKSDEELRQIKRDFYHNLAEVVIGTLNMVHMPLEKRRRYISTADFWEQFYPRVEGRDFLVLMAHQGLWELGLFWGQESPDHMTLGVYHELHSKVLDLFYQRLRTTESSIPVQKKELMRFYLQHRKDGVEGRRVAIGLIADQHPNIPVNEQTHWYRFLNQDSVFFDGAEQLAVRYGLPIWFADFERVGKGRYRIVFEMLYDGEEKVEKHEITERYVRRLEQMICRDPHLWMWSHRRWKHKRNVEE
jgi:KDO2-lipid IV(A) lauroyltransferase